MTNTGSWVDISSLEAISLAIEENNILHIITGSFDQFRLKGAISNICPSIVILIRLSSHLMMCSLYNELCYL